MKTVVRFMPLGTVPLGTERCHPECRRDPLPHGSGFPRKPGGFCPLTSGPPRRGTIPSGGWRDWRAKPKRPENRPRATLRSHPNTMSEKRDAVTGTAQRSLSVASATVCPRDSGSDLTDDPSDPKPCEETGGGHWILFIQGLSRFLAWVAGGHRDPQCRSISSETTRV